jgi:hypothetical protein
MLTSITYHAESHRDFYTPQLLSQAPQSGNDAGYQRELRGRFTLAINFIDFGCAAHY